MDKQDEILKKLDEIHARLDGIEKEINLLRNPQTTSDSEGWNQADVTFKPCTVEGLSPGYGSDFVEKSRKPL